MPRLTSATPRAVNEIGYHGLLSYPEKPKMNCVRYVLVGALAVAAGCSKLTIENYDRVKVGMSYAEVKQILGDPVKCDEVVGVRNCLWGDDARQVSVSLAADRVVVHSAKGLK